MHVIYAVLHYLQQKAIRLAIIILSSGSVADHHRGWLAASLSRN